MTTQTMICTKVGSKWTSAADAHLELKADVATIDMTKIADQQLAPKFNADFIVTETLNGQELTIDRVWTNAEDLYNYKTSIAGIEEHTSAELEKLGWTFTETIV